MQHVLQSRTEIFKFPFFFFFTSCLYLCCLVRNSRVSHINLNLLINHKNAKVFLAVLGTAPKILGKHYKLDVNGIRETAVTSFASWLIFFWVITTTFQPVTPIRLFKNWLQWLPLRLLTSWGGQLLSSEFQLISNPFSTPWPQHTEHSPPLDLHQVDSTCCRQKSRCVKTRMGGYLLTLNFLEQILASTVR